MLATRWYDRSSVVRLMERTVGAGVSTLQRRKSGRIRTNSLASNIGSVVDVSAGGMRVLSRERLGGEVHVRLHDGAVGLVLHAYVVRCTRLGFRKYDVGLQFLNVEPDTAKALTALAAANAA